MRTRTRVTTKGQIVIPKALRERLHWRTGTRLRVEAQGAGVLLTPERADTGLQALLDQTSGCLRDAPGDPLAKLEAEHRLEIAADASKLSRRR
jgi:AbrB family looped-hinge helix DNA binding protein